MKLKLIILLALVIFGVKKSYAQLDVTSSTVDSTLNVFLVFDHLYDSNQKRTYAADTMPNYIQIVNDQAVLIYLIRNYAGFIEGQIQEKKTEFKDNLKVTSFYILGQNRSLGKRMSVEIKEYMNGAYEVHYFNKLSGFETFLFAHTASQNEIDDINAYFKSQQSYED
jgi:hypothetical protein